MDKSLRIKADIGVDQVINLNLSRDIDLYEILSLQLSQKNLYKKHSADYGVVVGRVLANGSFGVPNVKVSIFIPITPEDSLRGDIRSIYPFNSTNDYDSNQVKYNTLPNYKKFDCHAPVGTFPKKTLVLDDDVILEIFDKYYRFTTVTNKSGDYMLFGVPTGNHTIHMDLDLSDIGILSQKPRDLLFKGYTLEQFESPTKFKSDTMIETLPQIIRQDHSITVYPFWGDKDTNQIAITRKDLSVNYKFEPTCVFIGSVITDGSEGYIAHNCVPEDKVGDAAQLVSSEGTIEMIRKRIDGQIEEFSIKGNRLIDGDGVFCYQIPMNLDYIGMDENGNIVPTDNPNKGIPTRARVRFRFTLDEFGNSSSKHKARYLVPNNPDLMEDGKYPSSTTTTIPRVDKSKGVYKEHYIFGSDTPDECFRDLYWNKVYSVKNYIPRVQKSMYEKTTNYLAIKGVNKKGTKGKNIIPFNKINLNFSLPAQFMLANVGFGTRIFSGFWNYMNSKYITYNVDGAYEGILEETDGIGLDFYNDWLNGCLYFPSWYWHIAKKAQYNKGDDVYDSSFCQCGNGNELYIYSTCSLPYSNKELKKNYNYEPIKGMFHKLNFGTTKINGGIIQKHTNKDGGELFYYAHGCERKDNSDYYCRLFSTDIILLGSLDENDIDGIPMISGEYPVTTANIPPLSQSKDVINPERPTEPSELAKLVDAEDNSPDTTKTPIDTHKENDFVTYKTYNGMNWGSYWGKYNTYSTKKNNAKYPYSTKFTLRTGLFFGLTPQETRVNNDWLKYSLDILTSSSNFRDFWRTRPEPVMVNPFRRVDIIPFTDVKTCVNVERICELGVGLDGDYTIQIDSTKKTRSTMDGLINRREIFDTDLRSLFASLNYNKLNGIIHNPNTGYKKYRTEFLYPSDFDGRLETEASAYTNSISVDRTNLDYLDFRFGSEGKNSNVYDVNKAEYKIGDDGNIVYNFNSSASNSLTRDRHFYDNSASDFYAFPLYNNSFYFYFGLNNGNTAIDKFYSKYYGKCTK